MIIEVDEEDIILCCAHQHGSDVHTKWNTFSGAHMQFWPFHTPPVIRVNDSF